MNLSAWNNKKCVAVPENFWREKRLEVISYISANPEKIYLLPDDKNFFNEVISYISANPEKIYLLPDDKNFFNEEISARVATEIKFPCSAKLITSAAEFEIDTLSDVLNAVSYDENFMPTGKNFLVVPQNFSDTANAIGRQCAVLQVPIEICSEKEFSSIAAEQKLADNAKNLLRELDGVKTLNEIKTELKLEENISCVEKFLLAAKQLENFCNESIKLIIAGDSDERRNLSRILSQMNFETENCANTELAEKLPNCTACLFTINAPANDFSQTENFLQAVADSPNKGKIFFVLIRPALREREAAINPSRRLSALSKILDENEFKAAKIFFLDATDIFYSQDVSTLLETGDEITVDEITNALNLSGRKKYFTEIALRKFFDELPNPSIKALLKKTGLPYLENYLRQSLKTNRAVTENLLHQVEDAVSFMEGDTLKKIRLRQMKKFAVSVRQAEMLREKILLMAMQEKTVIGKAPVKSFLYDVNNALNKFVVTLEKIVREIFDEFIASEEFCSEKIAALYQGKISTELEILATDTENKLQGEYKKQSQKLIGLIKKFFDEHKALTKKFICSSTKHFSNIFPQNITLPETQNFDLPPFDAGLTEVFSRKKLSDLAKHCTRIICTREINNADLSSIKVNRGKFLKNFYLAGKFRKELRQSLNDALQNKMSEFEKNLRQQFFSATLKYFEKLTEICRGQRESFLKMFRQRTKDIYNKLDSLDCDFVVMEEIILSQKNFYESWRNIFPKQNQPAFGNEDFSDELAAEIFERKNILLNAPLNNDEVENLSGEIFLPIEAPYRQPNSDAVFSSGKAEFRNKKYENAFKIFSDAAATGHIESVKYLAYMYQNGLGVPKNIYAAVENYLDSFSLGDKISASELYEIFFDLKCYSVALEWYQTALDSGYEFDA